MADSLIDAIRQKRQRVAEIRAELTQLEAELREAKAELLGRPTGGRASRGRQKRTTIARRRPIKDGSSVELAVRVLRAAEQPLHIDAIIARIKDTTGMEIKKPTLVSNLSRYVADGETFTRPAASTYGLKEFESTAA